MAIAKKADRFTLDSFCDDVVKEFAFCFNNFKKRGFSYSKPGDEYNGILLYNSVPDLLDKVRLGVSQRLTVRNLDNISVNFSPSQLSLINLESLREAGFYPVDVGAFIENGWIIDIPDELS